MASLIGYKDTYKIVSYQPKQLILLESIISFEWISVKCDNGKINAKNQKEERREMEQASKSHTPGHTWKPSG